MTAPTPPRTDRPRLSVGDHGPLFACEDCEGGRFEFRSHVQGKPLVMIFAGDTPLDRLRPIFAGDGGLDGEAAQVLTFVPGDADGVRAQKIAADWPFRTLVDDGNEITTGIAAHAAVKMPAVFVLDPKQRIAEIAEIAEIPGANDGLAARINACVQRIAFKPATVIVDRAAPVLMVPRVLEPDACDWLIELWHASEKQEGRVGFGSSAGNKALVDRNLKRRLDYVVDDGAIQKQLVNLTMPRLVPEIENILHYQIWQIEAFRVGRYDAEDAGFFNLHRDDCNISTQNRRFALTINLNTGDYEGGHLRFPEYGPELFCPPRGGAILFSCSMLHEVVPVTRGTRYTLLSFFVDKPKAAGPASR